MCVDVQQRTSVLRSYGGLDKSYYSFWYRYNLDSSSLFRGQLTSIEDIYNMSNTESLFKSRQRYIYVCIYLLSKTTLGEAGRDTNTTLSISISIYICIKIDSEHLYIYFVFCSFFLGLEKLSQLYRAGVGQRVAK